MELINKAAVVAEIERRIKELQDLFKENEIKLDFLQKKAIYLCIDECKVVLSLLNTLEVKEVDIASMADEYYDALIKEAEMDVDMAGHCRLAYYNGCKDVLNKIQKGD